MKYLRHMATFAIIVESGSISAAAEALDSSKSVISQQLKDLEKALGVALLNRTTRSQRLTPVGREFYKQSRAINELGRLAWSQARNSLEKPSGPVTISAPHALIETLIAPTLGRLTAEYPDITVTLLSEDQRINLHQHQVDIAIRVGQMPDSEYRQKKLMGFRERVCASPAFIARHQQQITHLSAITDYCSELPYIVNDWQGKKPQHLLTHKYDRSTKQLQFRASQFCNSLTSVIGLAEAGAGLALVPDFLLNNLQQQQRLMDLFPDFELPEVPVYAVHCYGKHPSLPIQYVLNALEDQVDNRS